MKSTLRRAALVGFIYIYIGPLSISRIEVKKYIYPKRKKNPSHKIHDILTCKYKYTNKSNKHFIIPFIYLLIEQF